LIMVSETLITANPKAIYKQGEEGDHKIHSRNTNNYSGSLKVEIFPNQIGIGQNNSVLRPLEYQ